jgi:GNAT superfamily N-acetyltransferase
MTEYGLSIQICKSQEELKATQDAEMVLLVGLGKNIIQHIGNVELGKSFKIFIRDKADEVVGGTIVHCFGGWAYISLLWIDEALRNQGYGTQLMHLVEQEAIQLGCHHAHVDTYSFEARPFYERLGYEVFGILEDYPKGYCKYFLKKRL